MTFSSWIYIEDYLPWTSIYSIDVNESFTTNIANKLIDVLVECDLKLYIEFPFKKKDHRDVFEWMNRTFGVELKDIILDNNPTINFNNTSINCKTDFDGQRICKQLAEVVIINNKYVWFSCTTYVFWNDISEYLAEKLNTNNLGGSLLKLGAYPKIDEKLKIPLNRGQDR